MAKDPAQKANRDTVPTNLDSNHGQGQDSLAPKKANKNPGVVHDITAAGKNKARLLKTTVNKADNESLKSANLPQPLAASEPARKEVEIIERELKIFTLQQEVEQLRPLSGLYRVIKAVATERGLEPLLEVIAQESKAMLKCNRLSVYIL